MLKELNEFLIQNKFKIENNFAYGIYKDRTLSIKEKGSYVKVSVGFNGQIGREVGMQLSSKLKELKDTLRALQHAVTTNINLELIIYKSADFAYEFNNVLDETIKLLDQYVPSMVDVCPICGTVKTPDSPFVKIKDTVVQAHEFCIDHLINASNEMGADALLKFDKVSFLKTLLSSLLVLLAVTLSVCVASYYGLYGIISALSGWICYFVMNIVLKKMNIQIKKDQIIIVSVASLLTLLLSIYFGSVIEIYRNINASGATFALIFKQYFTILGQNMDTLGKYVIINLAIGLLFITPTIIANFRQLKQTLNSITKLK